jgi:hypothetical protein
MWDGVVMALICVAFGGAAGVADVVDVDDVVAGDVVDGVDVE